MHIYRSEPENKPKSTYQRPVGMTNLFGQVEEVKDTMKQNIEDIMARGEKLEQLDDTAREMLGNAEQLTGLAKNKNQPKKK